MGLVTPSFENMRRIMDVFAHDRALVTDELAQLRYEASIQPGFQESFGAMFPAPRQRWVDAMASPEAAIRALPHETLVIHGREDQVIPLATSLTLADWIPQQPAARVRPLRPLDADRAQCPLRGLVGDFLAEAD